LNDIFSYKTPKYVVIRDLRLGCTSYFFMAVIFIKIGVLNIFMQCMHLRQMPVVGNSRVSAMQPTHHCNALRADCMSDFTPMSKLPYCLQFRGPESQTTGMRRADCEFWDGPGMQGGPTPVPGTAFIPTRVTTIKQTVGCRPTEENDYACDTKPYVHANPSDEGDTIFVADVERFTLLISQAFKTEEEPYFGGQSGSFHSEVKSARSESGLQLNKKLPKRVTAKFKHKDTDGSPHRLDIPDKPDPKSEFPSLLSLNIGDVISLGDLIKLADPRGVELLDAELENGETLRHGGAVLEVTVEYDNYKMMDPLGTEEPYYTISASILPLGEYKIMYYKEVDGDSRVLVDVHGILIVVHVVGRIRVFSFSQLLTVLTTAMVSLAIAGTATDFMMTYCMADSTQYKVCQNQPTLDFGDFRTTMKALKAHHGPRYDPFDHKPVVHADILNNQVDTRLAPDHEDLLLILCKFEQRLNTLDGMDITNTLTTSEAKKAMKGMDKIARYIHEKESNYKFAGLLSNSGAAE